MYEMTPPDNAYIIKYYYQYVHSRHSLGAAGLQLVSAFYYLV